MKKKWRGKEKNGKQYSVLFLMGIFAVLTVTALVLFFSLQTDPIEEVVSKDRLLNVLFVLYDDSLGKEDAKVITTDVIMYYPVTKRSAMFDIPGRTGAIYSTLGKVDAMSEVYLQKGIDSYKQEIEKLLEIRIPFTIEISLSQFSRLTDFLGGLRLFIPSPIDIRSEDDVFLLPSGSVRLDGDKICTYLKYRNEDDSYSDIQERNQNVVLSFISAIHEEQERICSKRMTKELSKLMKTNVGDNSALKRLIFELSSIDSERLSPQTITGSVRNVDGVDLLFPYYDGQLIKDSCKQSMNALVSLNDVAFSRTYVMEILNGTTVQGLARNTSALFQSIGYNVMPTGNADRNNYEKTIIIDHIGNSDVAKALGNFILCDNIVVEEIKSAESGVFTDMLVDFTIILGEDFDGRYVH
ncbi:MAG: LCP family protein [Treponemataceae bacterium]